MHSIKKFFKNTKKLKKINKKQLKSKKILKTKTVRKYIFISIE